MSDEIQQNRYDQLVRRVAGIIGPGSKVSQVITELFPMIDVENLPAELYLLSGTRLGFGGTTALGAGGEVGRHQLFNPVDSGQIITLTSVVMSTEATSKMRWGRSAGPIGAVVSTQVFRDTRLPVATRPVGQIRFDSTAAFSPATGQVSLTINVAFTLQDPNGVMVLAPGEGFDFSNNTAGTRTNSVFYWRERPAQPSELNF